MSKLSPRNWKTPESLQQQGRVDSRERKEDIGEDCRVRKMKGGKKRNSSSDLQSLAPPLSEPSATVNGGGDFVAEECRISQDESQKLVSAEEAFEEEGDSEAENESDDQVEEGEAVEDEGEATKLADGYYEIEAVRRKRVRKGQVQYLIKWRGWPETANTWEPFKNLMQCWDYIESFEERLKAGKSRLTRKRKRKSSINHVLPKKKQREQWHRPPAFATYSVPQHAASIADEEHTHFSSLNDLTGTSENGEVNANGVSSSEISKLLNDSYVRMISEKAEQNELDLNPCKLKGEKAINMEDIDRAALTSGESQPTEVVTLENALRKTDGVDPAQPGRCTGAKKRKSGSIKRFKKDPVEDPRIREVPCTSLAPMAIQNPDFPMNNVILKNKYEDSYSSCTITQVIKTISYRASVSNNVHDVLVVFEAMRSDGTKVTVDNKFLKANNPLLLIDYYERNLGYNPA